MLITWISFLQLLLILDLMGWGGSNTTVSSELLMDVHNPCLIFGGNEKEEHNYIITPWDIVMKTLKSDHIIDSSSSLASL